MSVDFVTGDTGSKLSIVCVDVQGNVISLVNSTVLLRWKNAIHAVVAESMTVVDAVNGIAEYQFGATDLFSPAMFFEVEITDQNTFIVTNLDLIEVEVRDQLG